MQAEVKRLTCREFVEFLADYLSRQLQPAQTENFDAHLARCPQCAAYLQTYRETLRLAPGAYRAAEGTVPPDVPEELVRAIMDSLAAS
jgi:anti-sigma factor RsiW